MNAASFPASVSTPATSIDEVIAQLTAKLKMALQTILLTMVRVWNGSISFLPIAIFISDRTN